MKILVTGGDGFIGRYVQSRCKELGIEAFSFDIAGDIQQDVTEWDHLLWAIDQYEPDSIIHLAGLLGTHELWGMAEDAIDVNIKGTLNVARAALKADAKLISIEQPHVWYNMYEATKFAARRMLTGLHYDEGLRVDFVTAHNAFGPGQAHGEGHPQKIIPTFATKAWAGEDIPIWGDGNQMVNLVYVGDVADSLIQRALIPHGYPLEHFQAGTDTILSVSRVALMVLQYVADSGGGTETDIDYRPARKGEQPVAYPEPDETFPYTFQKWLLRATIDSYRPE